MKSFHFKLILFLVKLGNSELIFSQNQISYFYENEFELSFPVKENWSLELGFGNRGLLAEELKGELSGYQHQHLEINQFTNFKSSNFLVYSLGLRYRFKEFFDQSETNEFRIIEQIGFEFPHTNFLISHRIRLEQRFRENTIHRMRYELGFSQPLNQNFSWGADTEFLYAISSHLKPEAEQRFSLGLENSSFKDADLEIIFQYRMEDYARNLGHEFFIITGVSVDF